MKKEKVLALLLTATMCATTASPVFAADFADETAETVTVTAENNAETETGSLSAHRQAKASRIQTSHRLLQQRQ